MPDDPGAASLLRSVGLLADGPIVWGRPLPARGPGVFVVELPAPLPTAPLELTRIGKWIERVESLVLDGQRPTSKELAARLSAFWLPSRSIVYIGVERHLDRVEADGHDQDAAGRPPAELRRLLAARRCGARHGPRLVGVHRGRRGIRGRAPHRLRRLRAGGGPGAARTTASVVLPFANLRRPTGERPKTGITGALIAEPVAAPAPADTGRHGRRMATRTGPAASPAARPAREGSGRHARKPATPTAAAPTAAGAATAAARAATDPRTKQVHLTTEGIARLEAELEILTTQKRPEVIGRIRAAKELGDLKENADYTAAREEQSFLEGRIQSIEAQLRDAVVIQAPAAGSRVGLGSVVTVETDGDEMRLEIVGTTGVVAEGRAHLGFVAGRAGAARRCRRRRGDRPVALRSDRLPHRGDRLSAQLGAARSRRGKMTSAATTAIAMTAARTAKSAGSASPARTAFGSR